MKKIVIGLVALCLLGGGAGAFFFMHQPAEASLTEESKRDAELAAKEAEIVPPGEFVELDPLILPIVTKNGVTQVISLVVALEIEVGGSSESVKLLKPRLKDAYIQDMYGALNDRGAMHGGVVRVDVLKKRLNEITAKVLGEGTVREVLLQVVQQRPI